MSYDRIPGGTRPGSAMGKKGFLAAGIFYEVTLSTVATDLICSQLQSAERTPGSSRPKVSQALRERFRRGGDTPVLL